MSLVSLPAPAKLNLFLHITGRRADGYHSLETYFQLLDHGDVLDFDSSRKEGVGFSCSRADLASADNLVLKAAHLLTGHARVNPTCHIHLHKRLPTGAGLGGGSSDAATTLLVLNRLWQCGLSQPRLAELGLSLGADVPVFINGHSAFATGIGEKLVNQPVPQLWYLVLTPACEVSTREIFCHPELTRNSPSGTMRAFPFLGSRNDCQAVACQLYPSIKAALDWLGQFGEARMSGTGSSVFAGFTTREHATEILSRLPAASTRLLTGCQGFVAQGVNRSPLLVAMEQLDGAALE